MVKVLKFLPLVLVAFPLQGQTRVELLSRPDLDTVPIMVAVREAILASGSCTMERDSTRMRFWLALIPGGGMTCGTGVIRSVGIMIKQVGPNYRSAYETIQAYAYIEGDEAGEARKILALLDQTANPR